MHISFKKVRNQGRKTRATIVEILQEQTRDGKTYRLVLEFNNSEGAKVRQKLNTSSGLKPKKELPYPVDIYYLKENEKYHIIMDKDKLTPLLSIIFITVGLSCLVILILEFTNQINVLT